MRFSFTLFAAALFTLSGAAFAHGDAKHEAGGAKMMSMEKEQKPFGIGGDPAPTLRTVTLEMTDQMRFVPSKIEVRKGETIRIRHHNAGKVMHEMVIGTKASLDEHAAMMKRFPNMEHDEPYMSHVAPGGMGEIVWTFNRAGTFDFACLIPGHYEAGMVGQIVVSEP